MKKISIIVADDEALTRERIINRINRYDNFIVLAEAENGLDTLNAIKKHQPDVIFLDIKMPILNGFEVLKKLDQKDYGILVFITAHDQYAIKAFENEALDYLLKPFDNERFDNLMTRLQKRLSQGKENYILVKQKNEIHRIKTSDIIYVKSDDNYIQIHLENRVLKNRTSISSFIEQLDDHFFRIHRSYIINERKILKMKHIQYGDYTFLMSNGKRIPSSKSYRKAVTSIIR